MIEKKSNKPSGFGRLTHEDSKDYFFDGTFKDGKCHGHAMLIFYGTHAKVYLENNKIVTFLLPSYMDSCCVFLDLK